MSEIMSTRKLTLSFDREVIRQAKRFAKSRNTTVSSMVSKLLHAMARSAEQGKADLGPLTEEMSGVVRPRSKGHGDVLEEALAEKYGLKR
jgi:hypothetical protein